MLSKADLIFIAVFLIVLFVTKPSQSDIEAELKTAIIADINAEKLNTAAPFLENFLTLTCKVDAEQCYPIVRASLNVSYKDRLLFLVVGITVNGKKRNCVGSFKTLFCPSFLN